MRNGLKAVVFDFDGTLASLEIDFNLMRSRVKDLILSYGMDSSSHDRGYTLETVAAVRSALSETNQTRAEEFNARARALIEEIEMEAARRGSLFPFTRPALKSLKDGGYRLAVITRNFGAAVDLVFPDRRDFFSVFLPRESVTRVKPDPEHLTAAVRGLDVAAKETLMVGDHPIDIKTGQSAGTMTAGLASGRISKEELALSGADLTVDHVGQLAEYLLGGPLLV